VVSRHEELKVDTGRYWGRRKTILGVKNFTFVKGKSLKWVDPRTTPPIEIGLPLNTPSSNNPDVFWMQHHSTRLR
jgi:hypothetical protein